MSLATQPPPHTDDDPNVYTARRSQRVSGTEVAADGSIWEEKLAVCEGVNSAGRPQLLIRSFYRSLTTGEKLWDEPPSDAGSVIHASAEDRQKAESQRNELQSTLAMIPEDAVNQATEGEEDEEKPEPKKKGLFGRFRRKKDKEKKQVETAKDINLQRAIARSIAEQTYTGREDQQLLFPENAPGGGADDDVELAKALSMSVMEQQTNRHQPTEEELFQRALENSQRENVKSDGFGVASLPPPEFTREESSSSSFRELSASTGLKTPEDDDEAKPPAS